jgi:hypothetical protein
LGLEAWGLGHVQVGLGCRERLNGVSSIVLNARIADVIPEVGLGFNLWRAGGYSDNLLLRAAEVTLKERRPLVLVVRETPLTLIHIENMATVARAGAVVLPAMPAFYHNPKTIDELVDHLVGKVLDVMEVKNDLYSRWKESKASQRG